MSSRVDVHHHFVPQSYRDGEHPPQHTLSQDELTPEIAVVGAGGDPSGWEIPQWSKEADEAFMKNNEITTTILSLTAPGACILKGSASAKLARDANEYAAKMRNENPARWGFLATLLSLLDKEFALTELSHALDELKADGVTLFTRYGPDNHYLGHPDFKYI